MTSYLIEINGPQGQALTGRYLQGPRTPLKVKRDGYGFTNDIGAAWPFDSKAKAQAKARIVARHMSWSETTLAVVSAERGEVGQ